MKRSRNLTSLGVLLLAALVACSSSGAAPTPGPTTTATSTPSGSATSKPSGTVKPVIQGLIDRQGPPPANLLSVVRAYVVKVPWAQLQSTPFGPLTPDNPIDQAIARVRQPDYAGVGMVLKLRVLAGISAPEWAKKLGGSPIPYVNNQAGGSVAGGTIGRFWSAEFGRAYADLQTKLAAKYDDVPEVREITVSRCSTIFDELFVRQPGDQSNSAGLISGGYTKAQDETCISQAIRAHAVWKHTTSDIDFSPFPDITDPNKIADVGYTESVMRECRAVLGRRCGLQNNAISVDKLAVPAFQSMYTTMTGLGPPIELQTAARKRLGDPAQVLPAAVHIGANSVELPAGYPRFPLALLQQTRAGLLANPLP